MRGSLVAALVVVLGAVCALQAQAPPNDQVQVGPPPQRQAATPPALSSAEDLEHQADSLRSDKAYLDAIDYYNAALEKKPKDAVLINKIGICELLMHRLREARKTFEKSIKANHNYPEAYNNLGVVYYADKNYKKAIKQYEKALKLRQDAPSYYSNLGAAYFGVKQFEKASAAYAQALQLDPDIFDRISRSGISAQLSSPEDRAHYDYVLARLFAKSGNLDRSLLYLGRALEEGYKGINDVYKDQEFADLRKDPRFAQLMNERPPAIPE
jgi:tetratricopeptide (TPR) repeat protein